MSDIIPRVQVDLLASGQAPAGRNKITELGELSRKSFHLCGADSDHNEEPTATILRNPLCHCLDNDRAVLFSKHHSGWEINLGLDLD